MSLESITETIKQKVGNDCGLGATLKFGLGSDGVVLIDATKVPNVVTNADDPAQCTIKMKLADLEDNLDLRRRIPATPKEEERVIRYLRAMARLRGA